MASSHSKHVFPVKFIVAITRSQKFDCDLRTVLREYGEYDDSTGEFDFNYTSYYGPEMGPELLKQFVSFNKLIDPEKLSEIKLSLIKLEKKYSVDGKRRVNLDPMYLELAKLVVASHKNYAHRILIGKGIYGDVQLTYKNGAFHANEWTYPDYVSDCVLSFLMRVRANYYQALKDL